MIRTRQLKWKKKLLKKYAFVWGESAVIVEDLLHTQLKTKQQQEEWILNQKQQRPELSLMLLRKIQLLVDMLSFKAIITNMMIEDHDVGQLFFDRIWLNLAVVFPIVQDFQFIQLFNLTSTEPPLEDPCVELAFNIQSIPNECCWILPLIRDWVAWSIRGGLPFIFDVAFLTWFPTVNIDTLLASFDMTNPEKVVESFKYNAPDSCSKFPLALISAAVLQLCSNNFGFDEGEHHYYEEHNAWLTNVFSNFSVSCVNPFVRKAFQLHAVDHQAFGDYLDYVQDANIRLNKLTWDLIKSEVERELIDNPARIEDARPWLRQWQQSTIKNRKQAEFQYQLELKFQKFLKFHLLLLKHDTHPAVLSQDAVSRLFEHRWIVFFDKPSIVNNYPKNLSNDVGTANATEEPKPCKICSKPTIFYCVACKIPYCSVDCEKMDWFTIHRKKCKNEVLLK